MVELVPGATTSTEFDAMGTPLPCRPIWLYGAGLQVSGWQRAVMEAAPARVGVMVLVPAGMVVGVVETYSRERPVMGLPWVSSTEAVSGSGLFWLTVMGVLPEKPGAESAMEAGGQVEK